MGAQGGRFGGLWRDRRNAPLPALAVIRRATTYSAGGAGRDTIKGGSSGDDRLFADAGGALMVGGKGSDEFNTVNATEGGCVPDSAKIKAHA